MAHFGLSSKVTNLAAMLEILECAICHQKCISSWNRYAVHCDTCDKWYHAKCQGYAELQDSDVTWICLNCGAPNFLRSLFSPRSSLLSNSFSILSPLEETDVKLQILTGKLENQEVINSYLKSQLTGCIELSRRMEGTVNELERCNTLLQKKLEETQTDLTGKIDYLEDQNRKLQIQLEKQQKQARSSQDHMSLRIDALDQMIQQLQEEKQGHDHSVEDVQLLPAGNGSAGSDANGESAHPVQLNPDNCSTQVDQKLEEPEFLNERFPSDVADAFNIQQIQQEQSCPPQIESDEDLYLYQGLPPPPDEGILIWDITKFCQCREEAISGKEPYITSLPFFTSRPGYKVRARIYLNGKETSSEDTVVHDALLYCHLTKGGYDADINWPFKPEVTVSVFNQEAHMWEKSECSLIKDQSAFEKPSTAGISNPHVQCTLPVRYFQEKYTKDDILFVKVEICTHA